MRHLKFYRRAAAIAELHELGRTNKECRELLGINHNAVAALCRYLGIKLAYDMAGWNKTIASAQNRARKMAAMYRAGMTLQQIGEKYDMSRERVRQLIAKYEGMSRKDGGQHLKIAAKKQRVRAERDARYLEKYGCTFAEWNEVRTIGAEMRATGASIYQTPLRAFIQQRNNARLRGIAWELTFWQWWTIWQESRKWTQRGRAKDAFVMCRFNDEGPYATGNVFIGTLASNSSVQPNNPYRVGHPDHQKVALIVGEKMRKIAHSKRGDLHHQHHGLPLGVTKVRRAQRYIAQISINGKRTYLGSFATPDAAHAAYLAALLDYREQAA